LDVPEPLPRISHAGALLTADHGHPVVAVTLAVKVPPVAGADVPEGTE
jgi:hypothetical protein